MPWLREWGGRTCFAAGVLMTVCLLATACGNARRDFRVEKLEPLLRRVNEQRAQLASALRLARPGQAPDARVLRDQVEQLGATMRKVAALDPPQGTMVKFRQYTRSNAVLLASLSRFVDAFARGGSSRLQQAAAGVRATLGRASDAQVALQRALN